MDQPLKWVMRINVGVIIVFLTWWVIIPIIGTILTRGSIGVTKDGGEMAIDAMIPWPSKELWCYEGRWQHESEKIEHGDTEINLPRREFHGYSYIWDLDVQ